VGNGAILPADGLLKHMCTVGGDDGAILPADGLLKHMCTVGGDDGVILPADGLLIHMCTVGGDDGAILPAAVLLKLQQPRSTLDNSLLTLLHPHDSHRYFATKRGVGDE
jgi:hypothetical protein